MMELETKSGTPVDQTVAADDTTLALEGDGGEDLEAQLHILIHSQQPVLYSGEPVRAEPPGKSDTVPGVPAVESAMARCGVRRPGMPS